MEWKKVAGFLLLCLAWVSATVGEEYSLRYFMEKSSLKTYELPKKERAELLKQVEELLEKTMEVQRKLTRTLQEGEPGIKYQEGRLWMSMLEEDQKAIDSGAQQVSLLKDKPTQLVAAVKLYKSLRDLSFHFSAYNNVPYFSAHVGDVAPELGLWTDPVFYKLYLLPLAQSRSVETKSPTKEKKQEGKGKKP
jgi:hypothetical protein